jgi:hypothetical protein
MLPRKPEVIDNEIAETRDVMDEFDCDEGHGGLEQGGGRRRWVR